MQELMEEKKIKRVAPRNPTEATITFRLFASSDAVHPSDGVMYNFSNGGFYIETTKKYNSGTALIVRMINYPAIPSSIGAEERPRSICLAEVKWWKELADENVARFGLGLRCLE